VGTSRSGAELAGKLSKLAGELADTRRPLAVAALAGKEMFAASVYRKNWWNCWVTSQV
jgi:hypothetical protein